MKNLMVVAVFVAAALSANSARAACGGGGWHPADPNAKPVNSQPVSGAATPSSTGVVVKSSAPTVTAAPAPAPAVYAVVLDTSKFDALSSKMDLTEKQWKDINKAKEKIRDQSDKLVRNQAKAQSKLAHCEGDCESEQRKLAKTSDELRNYNPNHEFEQKLSSILSSGQMATLQATSAPTTPAPSKVSDAQSK